MPGFDGTGPMGGGAMTGGARGFCNPRETGYAPYGRGVYGRGLVYRRGNGGGGRPGFGQGRKFTGRRDMDYDYVYPNDKMAAEDEMHYLKARAADMARAMDAINRRIDAMDKKESET